MKLFDATNGREDAQQSHVNLRGKKGFTLIEILISLAIMSIVTAAVYQLYISQYKTWVSQDLVTEMQQNGRVAIDTISRDMLLMGYGMTDPIQEVSENANNDKIAFLYKDPEVPNPPAGKPFIRIMYWRANDVLYRYKEGKETLAEWTTPISWPSADQPLGENVTALNFTYFKEDGTTFTPAADTYDDIYRIRVSIKVRTSRKDPISNDWKYFTLSTDVRPRNIGLTGGVSTDTTGPAAPTGLVAVDPGKCGTLWLKWNPNATEVDLAGYIVYYGLTAGDYTGKITIPKSAMDGNPAGEYYELTGLTTTASNATGAGIAKYFIAVVAYDNNGNPSAYSAEVSGTPAASTRDFATPFTSTVNDTTINVIKPTPPVRFRGRDGAALGQAELLWTPSTDANVAGYRIFRSTQPFTFASYPPGGESVTQLAGAPGDGFAANKTLTNAASSFTDDSTLNGCQVYYYAIIPVTCDSTLISYDDGDDNSKRAIVSDYSVTYGDGATDATQTNGQAGIADVPAWISAAEPGSDTAPNDTSAPAAPEVVGRAGWRRVAITVKNTISGDFSKTCLYVEKGGEDGSPTLDETRDANGCFNVVGALSGTRGLIPDASPASNPDGIFTNTSPVSFWHDSMTLRNPALPNLAQAGAEVQSYAYKAVTFDKCGNPQTPADAASATTVETTNLCGEDPEGKPNAPGLPAVSATACTQPVPLSQSATIFWTPVPSDVNETSTSANPWDLAGYRIFRSGTTDFTSATLLNPGAPNWCEGTCDYPDDTVVEGETYYYKITSTDCPYEKENPSTATITADMNSDTIHSTPVIGPIRPGQIARDEKCAGGGSCDKDLHREVVTGVTIAADNTTAPVTTPDAAAFRHNTVMMFFDNTSAGEMTIQRATVYWLNSAALLTKVTIGGGRSGLPVTTTSGLSSVSGADNDITDATITGKKRYVPVTFEFKDSGGNPVDMREGELQVILNVKNESTGTTTCLSYLTTTTPQTFASIVVPVGPTVLAVTQDMPASPTFGYAVPGGGSPNTVPNGSFGPVLVDGGTGVWINVSFKSNTTGVDGNKIPISSAKLYYKVTDKTVTTAPTSGYTELSNVWPEWWGWWEWMGDGWGSGSIPAQEGMRIWYYVVVIDSDGNFDREPEIENGAFTYDQKAPDPCDKTPYAPQSLSGTVVGGNSVQLTWWAPGVYSDWAGKFASDDFKYNVYRRDSFSGSYTKLTTGGCGAVVCNPGTWAWLQCSCTDDATSGLNVNANDNSYYVKAVNSCDPANDLNISAASNTWAECEGSAGFVITVDRTTVERDEFIPVRVTVNMCSAAANGAGNDVLNNLNITAGNDTDIVSVNENGSTGGLFVTDIYPVYDWYYPNGYCDTWDGYLSWGGLLCVNNTTDTITVSLAGATGSPQSIAVTSPPPDPCADSPSQVTGLTGTTTGNTRVNLSWAANADGEGVTGYKIYERYASTVAGLATASWVNIGTTASRTTVTYERNPTPVSTKTNVFEYKVTAVEGGCWGWEGPESAVWRESNN